MVVVAYGRILPPEILALPSVGPLNVHASLLPRYRGTAPINWALIRGERETGVSIQWMENELDPGPIFLQERVPINEEDNAGALSLPLADTAPRCWSRPWNGCAGEKSSEPQPQAGITCAPPITREMRRLKWQQPAREVAGWIRGLDPSGAYAFWQEKVLKLFGARVKKSQENWRPRERCWV